PPVSEKPWLPVPARPSPPADLQKPSQRISLRPTMFRTACDNSVTTPQPASPAPANLTIWKCPPARPMCTKPDRANPSPLPHHRAPAAHRNPSRQHLPSAPQPPAAPTVSFHSAAAPYVVIPAGFEPVTFRV